MNSVQEDTVCPTYNSQEEARDVLWEQSCPRPPYLWTVVLTLSLYLNWGLILSGNEHSQPQDIRVLSSRRYSTSVVITRCALITAITSSQGRAARQLLFKEKRQSRAVEITSATVNTLPSAESLELSNFENAHLFPGHTMHTDTHADHTAMVSSASPHLPDPWATQSKYTEI